MALKKSGVQLVAEGDAAFMAVMMQAGRAVVEFGQGADAAGSRVAAMQQRVTRLTDTIELQNRQLGIMQRQLAETAQQHGADSIQAQKQQLAVDKLSASIRNNEATLNRLQGELKQVDQAQEQAGRSASRLGEVMTGALRRAGELAINLFTDIAHAAIQGIGVAIDQAGDYEQAMNLFQATTGASADQMEHAGQLAKDLGADLTLPATSAASAGAAMNALAQAGLSVDDAMGAAKGTLQLAAAGMLSEAGAAEITAAALNQFGLAGTDATHVADLLAASISASGSRVEQTGQAVQQAGVAFARAGVPIEDFITVVNEMSKAGIRGSDAGTSLKTMLQRLQSPTDKASAVMRDLGVTVYDAGGAMRPMRDIIGQFSNALTGLTQEQRDQAIVTIFGADAMRAANIVLAGGVEAYDAMAKKVNVNGAAATQAAAQMKGLKGTIQGLQSQVETLTLEALEPLLPIMTAVVAKGAEFAGSFVGKAGPAVETLIAILSSAGEVFNALFIPAVSGATAALIAYAITSIPAALAALPGLIVKVATATTAFVANAAAVAAAAAPYVLIAAAVAGVAYAWNDLKKKEQDATEAMLAGKQFWIDSAAALDRLGQASEATQQKLGPLADSIRMQRDMLEENIQSLARRKEAGTITEAQFAEEMSKLNGLATAITFASDELDRQTKAELEVVAASMTATEHAADLENANADLGDQIELTAEEIEKLGKTLEKVYQDGAKAVDSYVNAVISFNQELTKAVKEGNDEQAKAVAANYAEQAAAARASLGEQLSQYTIAQMQLGNITREQASTILGAIEKEFGTTESVAASTFLKMEQSIDSFAQSGGQSADALGSDLDALAQNAVETKEKMDALAKKYEAELIENFKDGKIDADELRRALEDIPSKVYSEVHIHTEYTSSGSNRPQTGTSGLQHGGPMRRGESRLVGEKGPEIFTAGAHGFITPNHRLPPASPAQIITPQPQIVMVQPASTQNTTNYNTTNNAGMGGLLPYDHLAALYGGRG